VGLGFELRAGTLVLEPHLQSILPWLFWRWESHELFAWAGLGTTILPSSVSQVARIIGVSHCLSSFLLVAVFLYSLQFWGAETISYHWGLFCSHPQCLVPCLVYQRTLPKVSFEWMKSGDVQKGSLQIHAETILTLSHDSKSCAKKRSLMVAFTYHYGNLFPKESLSPGILNYNMLNHCAD
jgi:hypothetical protein